MNSLNDTMSALTPRSFVDAMIRVGLITLLAFACLKVASPFVNLLVWGLALAVMLYPLHQKIARKIGGRQGLASTLMVLAVCLIIDPPLVLLSTTFVGEARDIRTAFQNDELAVAPPDVSVKEWPLIGDRVYQAWEDASTNLPQFIEMHAAQLEEAGRLMFEFAGDAVGSLFFFFFAFVIAGIMMAFAGPGQAAMDRIFCRVAGPGGGTELLEMVVETVRSVATGVLGVAFIQALLFGIGFALAGVPLVGLLTLIVMFIGIIQLPAAIIALPVIIYLWAGGDGSVGANVAFTVYFVIAGLSDNVLKPLLLGRGVKAPMPIILIGAIGGMISAGLIGLFLGAVLLAVGYEVFMKWSREHVAAVDSDPAQEA